jgi:hypothetical protein
MALTDSENSGFVMPVSPMYGGGYGGNGGGFGFGGGDWAWILLLLLIGGNGWGFGGGFGGGMMWPMMMGAGMNGFGLDYLYPWLNNSQHMSDGFRDQALQTSINGLQNSVTAGFGDVQLGIAGINQNICQTGNAITGAINNGFSAAEIAANGRQMANMQQGFGIQSAIQAGTASAAAGTADLKYTVAQEACNDRAALSAALNTILTHVDQKVQGISDKLCQLELDGVKSQLAAEQRENANLRSDLMYARGQASQIDQTAQIKAGQAAAVNSLVSELRSCPIPAQPVYGSQPIFTCPGNSVNTGCGCGNNFGFAA